MCVSGACGVVRVCKSVRGKCRRNLTRHAISVVLLSPRTARQSEDCLQVRVLRNPALLAQRALLTAAAFPAQHIRSALSFRRRFGGAPPATARASAVRRAIQPRLRSEALGRNTSLRAAQAQSRRLARPAVCACSASCRLLRAWLRSLGLDAAAVRFGEPSLRGGSFGAPVSVRSARDRRWRSAASRTEMPPPLRASLSTHRRTSRPARLGSSR